MLNIRVQSKPDRLGDNWTMPVRRGLTREVVKAEKHFVKRFLDAREGSQKCKKRFRTFVQEQRFIGYPVDWFIQRIISSADTKRAPIQYDEYWIESCHNKLVFKAMKTPKMP